MYKDQPLLQYRGKTRKSECILFHFFLDWMGTTCKWSVCIKINHCFNVEIKREKFVNGFILCAFVNGYIFCALTVHDWSFQTAHGTK